MIDAPTRNRYAFLVALLLLALTYAFAAWRTTPPGPLPVNAPPERFSAARAFEQLKRLVGDGAAHPLGSARNDHVRQQIVTELQRLELQPRVQEAFVCNRNGNCGTVHNIVVRLDGRVAGKAVLAVAHYDSVAAGPGAADDGSGVVSLLELARALQAGQKPQHAVILLFDEGEEVGLLGAQAFAEQDPWRNDVGVVVNLDARGTSGPSFMFETSGANGWLVQAMTHALQRPSATSLFPMVYDLLPNDTDLTVFKRKGLPGVNFAFLGGAWNYHTPLDNPDHLDLRSLQHQGENALGMVRALAEADLDAPPPTQVIFFDLLGSSIIAWPIRWTRPLALIALALALACLVVLKRRRALRIRQVVGTIFGFSAAIAVAIALGSGFTRLLVNRPDFSIPWIASPGAAIGASWGLGFMVVGVLAGRLLRRCDAHAVWLGIWCCWAVIGIALSGRFAGASYLFIAPALLAGGLGLLWLPTRGPPSRGVPTVLSALAAGAIWFPLAQAWYDTLGVPLLAGLSACGAIILSSLAPLIVALDRRAQWEFIGVTALVSVLLGATAVRLPQHSREVPVPISFVLDQDGDTGQARWLAEAPGPRLPDALQRRFPFSGPEQPLPWLRRRLFVRAAESPDLPPPSGTVLEDSTAGSFRHLRLHVTSVRQASSIGVAFGPQAQVEALTVNGAPVELQPGSGSAWQLHSIWAPPADGLDVSLIIKAGSHPALVVMDTSFGLPAAGVPLQDARASVGTPRQWGDRILVTRTLKL